MFNLFSGMIQAAIIANARTEWSKIPPNQITCVEAALQQQGSSVATLIQNGIAPGDSRVSGIVGNCRPQKVAAPQPTATNQDAMSRPMPIQAPQEKSPYVVEGLALGERVAFDSQEYQQYACEASEQYPGFTQCSRQRGTEDSIALLHSADGTVEYINRYIEPASFKPGEVDSEIKRRRDVAVSRWTGILCPPRLGLD
jgi:hypothetical protein